MKKLIYILLVIAVITGCKKNEESRTSGTGSINNLRIDANYAVQGFSFSTGRYISNLASPQPDITVDTTSAGTIMMMSNTFNPPFSKVGEYPDANSAKQAFDNLKSISNSQQWTAPAIPIMPNQVWVFRSGTDKYTKFRIISTKYEKRQNLGYEINYCEVNFDWVYQPDGTLTFP